MNNKLPIAYLTFMIIPLAFGCRGPVKGKDKNSAATSSLSLHVGDERYIAIDTKESAVIWQGASLGGVNPHKGYVYLSKGELMMENGQLMGGAAEVDMNTIEDEGHKSDNNLIKHLKDPDFFDVKKFPFATIAITKVTSINTEDKQITGNLTIKNITHPVTFPARVEVNNGIVKANGKLTIDRTLWDVRYKSGKFYEHLANGAISDSIEFEIKIIAKK
ncbi:YceI family protein [Pedobacter sp. KR3-3]|uniref:YceI family protein n=1 Tax=Pedobacter albus TaxID=3113905 RepID=A0ABU7I5I2_9SPHI|nr:YceI family protein [Pedobacter sp. KR3-3]MEE1944731.1 YceI family protein [Pedobacter sp. KR3-3]